MTKETNFEKYFTPTDKTTPEDIEFIKETLNLEVLEEVQNVSGQLVYPEGVKPLHTYAIDLTPSSAKYLIILTDRTVIYIEFKDGAMIVRSNESSSVLNSKYFQ